MQPQNVSLFSLPGASVVDRPDGENEEKEEDEEKAGDAVKLDKGSAEEELDEEDEEAEDGRA